MDKSLVLLETLANKMGTTAETLWPYMVHGKYTMGLIGATMALLFMIVLLSYVLWATFANHEAKNAEVIEGTKIAAIMFMIGTFIIGTFVLIPLMIHMMLCPEYHALLEILSKIN